jgi:dihydroflavonol-4-reductase
MKLASRTQPKGVGSYLRTHLGRVPRYDTTAICTAMHMTFRPSRDSLRDTLNDLVRWGHV